MSAYIQNHDHISFLADAAWKYRISWYKTDGRKLDELTRAEIDEAYRRMDDHQKVGEILADEQYRSVSYRYDDSDFLPGHIPSLDKAYEYRPVMAYVADGYDPRAILTAVRGYEYQSCEHPEWQDSEAFAICQVIKGHAISAVSDTLENSERFWEVDRADERISR